MAGERQGAGEVPRRGPLDLVPHEGRPNPTVVSDEAAGYMLSPGHRGCILQPLVKIYEESVKK